MNSSDAYELNIHVEKINGDWLFSSFTVIEFMEQQAPNSRNQLFSFT
ncbi:MAG: hypothetical protein JKY62_15615 [Desulfocapsa sp.]|jgi:hypothetical protein|uniref:Uncharacterized protein n=1 Tax=Desulfotalea psychrophila TaxID=84980 RepID=A0ABS3ASP4_9BACT|nr:hypothetical protein [Desulfocapsa sp.]MBN4068143.1 hypothetical protein [Desulfotalea psychrophila]